MPRRYIIALGLPIAAILLWSVIPHHVPDDAVYRFENVRGPTDTSIVPPAVPADWHEYEQGGESRLAILLTENDSSWLGLAHGLTSIGVPFIITNDYQRALKHKVVLVYPMVSGKVLSKEALQALAQFPRGGGTLIAQHVLGGGLNEVFGFKEAVANKNAELHLTLSPVTAEFTEPEEKTFRIAGEPETVTGMVAYTNPAQPPLATYEDGSAAITRKSYGSGHAYAVGISLGHLLLKGHNSRQEKISPAYVNQFVPTLDVLLRLLRNIYLEGEKNAVTLATVPGGKKLPVIFTHDIDFTRSMKNAVEYAELERERGISATHFIQTKYVRDWNDDVFFNEEGVRHMQKLQVLGMELASHSVAHAKSFAGFPMGDGREQYPDYTPFVKSKYKTFGGTILGELRVSRFLIEHFLQDYRVVSFRPGHLEKPYALPEAMAAAGYLYSSSSTANDSLTHLPFRRNYGRGTEAETSIFEFPITVEDELDAPMLNRLPQAIALANKLKRYGGLFVILIHPDILGQKLEFEKGFIDAMDGSVWYGSLRQFGDWWAARDKVEADVSASKNTLTLSLSAPVALSGLTLTIPSGLKLVSVSPKTLSARQSGSRLVLGELSGKAELILQ